MTLSQGRLVRPSDAGGAQRVSGIPTASLLARGRIFDKPVVDAALHAKQLLEAARARVEELERFERARLEALRQDVIREAKADAAAELAAHVLRLAAIEQRLDDRAIDRMVELARLLAERLLGEALSLAPLRVVALARRALDEARGARNIEIVAHPEDAPLLERALADGQLSHVARVMQNSERARGSLRLNTEIGTLDADLAPQLERLARRLRETLQHER